MSQSIQYNYESGYSTYSSSLSPPQHFLGDIQEYLRASDPAASSYSQEDLAQFGDPTSNQYTTALQASHELSSGNYPFGNIMPSQQYGTGSQVPLDQSINTSKASTEIQTPNASRKSKPKSKSKMPENGQPRSKRALKRAKIIEEHGSVSAVDHPKGTTRHRDDFMEWYDPEDRKWRLAAPLDNYRHHIILEDNAHDAYDIQPDSGFHEDDITTFPQNDSVGMKYWNLAERSSWGNIQDEDSNEVLYLLERPNLDLETPDPDYMMIENTIMLDPDDNPIIDWPSIPRIFSSAIEGGRVEAIRRIFPWLSLPQFRARMPRYVEKNNGGTKPLFGMSSLSQRIARFREVMECPAWRKHGRGTNNKAHTLARLASEGLQAESTEGLNPISRRAAEKRKKLQRGMFPENAGIFTLSETDRHRLQSKSKKRSRDEEDEKHGIQSVSKRARSSPQGSQTMQTQVARGGSSNAGKDNACDFSSIDSTSEITYVDKFDFSGEGFTDLRELPPNSAAEQCAIKTALSYTIADYRFINDCEPPVTNPRDSYNVQYAQIQRDHGRKWIEVVGANSKYAPVQLVGIDAWYISFSSVPMPNVPEHVMQRLNGDMIPVPNH